MSYAFRHDETVEHGVRRIAGEQLGRAIASLDRDAELHAGVHDARKRVKKVRGLLRLVRPVFRKAGRENAVLRDAARTLSELRDHAAMLEALDRLEGRHGDRAGAWDLGPLRRGLAARRDAAAAANDLPERIDAFRATLAAVRDRSGEWTLDAREWEALGPGISAIHDAARAAMLAAHRTARGDDFHDFRKRVKDHGYHARLLTPVWRPMMTPHAALLDELGEMLGEQHDLVTLAPIVRDSDLAPALRAALEDLVAEDRVALEARSLALGARVFAERPKALARRWGAWWAAWRAAPGQDDASEPASPASISAMLSSIP